MNSFDRDFLHTLVADPEDESVEELVNLVPDRDLEKIALTLPAVAPSGGIIGKGMHYLTAAAPLKMMGAGGGALYGALQDPGYDPMTGEQNSRLGNVAAYGLGGLAAGYGIQRGSRALLGMKGPTGNYLRQSQLAAAKASTNAKDRDASFKALRNAYRSAGEALPSEIPAAAPGIMGAAPASAAPVALDANKFTVNSPKGPGAFAMSPTQQEVLHPQFRPQGPIEVAAPTRSEMARAARNAEMQQQRVTQTAAQSDLANSAQQAQARLEAAIANSGVRPASQMTPEELAAMQARAAQRRAARLNPTAAPATRIEGGRVVQASVNFSKLASYVSWSKTAAGGNFLSEAAQLAKSGLRSGANFITEAGPLGTAIGGSALGAGVGAFDRDVNPYTGEREGLLSSMASGALKGGIAGGAIGHGVGAFNPAIQGRMTFGQNTGNLYDSAMNRVRDWRSSASEAIKPNPTVQAPQAPVPPKPTARAPRRRARA